MFIQTLFTVRNANLAHVKSSWVSCAINKGFFFEIAFVVVVDTHLPRFEARAYFLPHFDELTHGVIRAHSGAC